jgi:hypothetical protein
MNGVLIALACNAWLCISFFAAKIAYRWEYRAQSAKWIRPDMGQAAFKRQQRRMVSEAKSNAWTVFAVWPLVLAFLAFQWVFTTVERAVVEGTCDTPEESAYFVHELEKDMDRLRALDDGPGMTAGEIKRRYPDGFVIDSDGPAPEGSLWCTPSTCVMGEHTGPRHLIPLDTVGERIRNMPPSTSHPFCTRPGCVCEQDKL